MMSEFSKMISAYKKGVQLWMIVVICVVCAVLMGLQLALLYSFQSEDIVWQGVCKGGDLVDGQNTIVMTVHCPSQDEFLTGIYSVILASKNEDKVFYCEKTEGTIMKDETWECNVPGAKE